MGCGASFAKGKSASFHSQYFLVRKVGRGAFAQVHVAYAVSGQGDGDDQQLVAVKITDVRDREKLREMRRKKAAGQREKEHPVSSEEPPAVDDKLLKESQKEARILKKASATRFCTAYSDFFVEGGLTYIVMEKCDFSLPQWLERSPDVDEAMVQELTNHMLRSLAAIHHLAIVHRDVKPDNFMLSSQDLIVKLCDFGISAILPGGPTDESLTGLYGTPPFMSPQMLKREPYGVKTDIWSLGIIVHVLLHGEFAYMPVKQTRECMIEAIISGGEVQPSGDHVSPESADFLQEVLNRDPSRRPMANEARELKWFSLDLNARCSSIGSASEVVPGTVSVSHTNGKAPGVQDPAEFQIVAMSSFTTEDQDVRCPSRPISLRNMIVAARRIGAFDMRAPYARGSRNSVDDQLRLMQERHHGDKAVCAGDLRLSLMSSEDPTCCGDSVPSGSPTSPYMVKSFSSDSTASEATNSLPLARRRADSRKSTSNSLQTVVDAIEI